MSFSIELQPKRRLKRLNTVAFETNVNENSQTVKVVLKDTRHLFEVVESAGTTTKQASDEDAERKKYQDTILRLTSQKMKERENNAAHLRKKELLFEGKHSKLEEKIRHLEAMNERNEKRWQKEIQDRDIAHQQQSGQLRFEVANMFEDEKNALITQITELVHEKGQIETSFRAESEALMKRIKNLEASLEEEKADKKQRIDSLVASFAAHIEKFKKVAGERDVLKEKLANPIETTFDPKDKENEAINDCISSLTRQNRDLTNTNNSLKKKNNDLLKIVSQYNETVKLDHNYPRAK